ncbi:inducible alternative oxidase 2 [Sporothrix eucalyptigena]|uniref:Inducible alternative oxidase 2 n=1 Tax=Sporothrix eucalyptigena TaxID=1812306 RepID=A0ABP0BC93_9PEZI
MLSGSHPRTKKSQYINAVLRNPVEGLLDPEPIARKCNETVFQEGLVWHCDTVIGGIGNVGNMWLNCVRYAIEAGATTLILPTLGVRSTEDLLDLGGKDNAISISALFDVDHFLDSWGQVCPQMRAVVSDSDIPNLPAADTSPHLAPNRVKAFRMSLHILLDPTGWREAFDVWLGKAMGPDRKLSATTPFRVWQNKVMFQWNRKAAQNSPDFNTAFARLFRYPDETRRLAASVLWQLEHKLGRHIVPDAVLDAKTPGIANHLEPGRIEPGTYLGCHLRVADDAVRVQWPGYDAQAPGYIAEAVSRNLSAIYLATGSKEHRERFRQDAAASGIQVFTKEDLLEDADLEALQTLSWDQQALIDFDVLIRSAYFYGFLRSSFSWAVTIRRSSLPEAGEAVRLPRDEFRDNLSAIQGRNTRINPWAVWP